MRQIGVRVWPTRPVSTIFDDGHVHVTLTFLTPALPDDLDVLARPLSVPHVECIRSVDGVAHAISRFSDSTSALLAVNSLTRM